MEVGQLIDSASWNRGYLTGCAPGRVCECGVRESEQQSASRSLIVARAGGTPYSTTAVDSWPQA
jgi:hypothetical protein